MTSVTVTVTTDNPDAYAHVRALLEANPPDLDTAGAHHDAFVMVQRWGQDGRVLDHWASVYDGSANNGTDD